MMFAYDSMVFGTPFAGPTTNLEWHRSALFNLAREQQFKPTEELLLSGEKFVYALSWRYYWGYDFQLLTVETEKLEIEKRFIWIKNSPIIPALRDGRCLLLLCDTFEGTLLHRDELNKFSHLARWLEVPLKSIVFIDGNSKLPSEETPETVKFVSDNVFEQMGASMTSNTIIHPKEKPFKFLSYARHWNRSRQFFTYDLFIRDLLPSGLVSCSKGSPEWGGENLEVFKATLNQWDANLDLTRADEFLKSLPLLLDSDLVENLARNVNAEHYLQTYISIIHETHCHPESVFLSEKTFKTIAMKHPFIMMGSPGLLQEIRNLGYQTFHPFIDESYDGEINLTLRKNLVLIELEKIIALNSTECGQLMTRLAEITEFNYQHLLNYSNRNTYGKNTLDVVKEHCGK